MTEGAKKEEPAREIAAAVMGALAEAAKPACVEEQIDLFARPAVPAKGKDRLTLEEAAEDSENRRRAGRPPGSKNRSNVEMRRWLLTHGVNPHKWLNDWLMLSPEELAKRLGCSIKDAFDRQMLIANQTRKAFLPDLAPTDEAGKAAPVLNFTIGGVDAAQNRPPWEIDLEARAQAGLIDMAAEEVPDADA